MKTKNTTPTRGLSSVAQFFYDHAGYSYDPAKETAEIGRRRCARSLAKSEAKSSELGFKYEWEQALQHGRKEAAAKREARRDGIPWARARRSFIAQNSI